jgi:hypothetical protein
VLLFLLRMKLAVSAEVAQVVFSRSFESPGSSHVIESPGSSHVTRKPVIVFETSSLGHTYRSMHICIAQYVCYMCWCVHFIDHVEMGGSEGGGKIS